MAEKDAQGRYRQLFRYLDTVGDGSGDTSGVGDFASAPRTLLIKPASHQIFELHRMMVKVTDSGILNADKYGTDIVLTNGIHIHHDSDMDGRIVDFTDLYPVKTNADWSSLCYDVLPIDYGVGNGDRYLSVRWTLAKAGAPTILIGARGDYFAINLSDSFLGLVSHTFVVQGLKIG